MTERQGRAGDGGFSLLEAMVALVIAALTLEVLVSTAAIGVTAARTERDQARGVLRAQSLLAELTGARTLTPGARSGQDADGIAWRIGVKRLGVAPPFRSLRLGQDVYALDTALFEVTAAVSWGSGRMSGAVTLSSDVLAPSRDGS